MKKKSKKKYTKFTPEQASDYHGDLFVDFLEKRDFYSREYRKLEVKQAPLMRKMYENDLKGFYHLKCSSAIDSKNRLLTKKEKRSIWFECVTSFQKRYKKQLCDINELEKNERVIRKYKK